MSRFHEYDGDDRWNGGDLWTHRAYLALSGKKGRRALAELRDALLALPEKRLIEGALCTVGIGDRIAAMPETVVRDWDGAPKEYPNFEREELVEALAEYGEQGEGVCAIGAYVWHQKVKAGMDPAEAFAAIDVGGDEYSTTDAGEAAGLTFTLAWELASRNDNTYAGLTPEQRYVTFLAFIDHELARPPLTRPAPKPKRERPVKVTRTRRVDAQPIGLWL